MHRGVAFKSSGDEEVAGFSGWGVDRADSD